MQRTNLIPIALLAALTGCHVNAPKEPRADPYGRQQIEVTSERLRVDTAVGEPIVARDSSGDLVHVSVPIRSAINKTLYVDYFVTFFDRNGQRLSKLGPTTVTLEPFANDQIEFNSMSPRATDFQLTLRYAK